MLDKGFFTTMSTINNKKNTMNIRANIPAEDVGWVKKSHSADNVIIRRKEDILFL
jgi:hypothetical protein